MAQGEFLCDHSTHGGAYYMSRRHSSRIQDRRRIVSHPFDQVWTRRRVASAHSPVVKINCPVIPAQDGKDPKPHFMGKTQAHNEQNRWAATLFIPIKLSSLIGDVRHFSQSSCFAFGMPTPIYMVCAGGTPQMKWPSPFTPKLGRGRIETPPRISRRNGISVC